MAPVIGLLCGALWGAYLARRRDGNTKDVAQYAASLGIAGALIGLFVGIIIARSAG